MSKQTSANSGSATPKESSSRKGKEPKGAQEDAPVREAESQKDSASPGNKKEAPKLWADPLNPDLPPNWRFLLERGYIRNISFEFTSYGKSVMVDIPSTGPNNELVLLRKSGRDALNYFKDLKILDTYGRVPKTLLKNPLAGATPQGVTPAVGPKVAGVAPKRSLYEGDFEGGLPTLQKRCADVGRELTFSTFKGRILSLFVPDLDKVKTVEQWWRDATPAMRMRVLMDGKRFDAVCGRKDLVDLADQQMPNVSCPFRGSLLVEKKGASGPVQAGDAAAEGSNDSSA
jgi:hypothetical protein